MRTGIIHDLPISDYHADPAISKSGLKLLLEKTPAHYHYQYRNPKAKRKPPSADMLFGQALHDLTLEPEIFKARYVEWKLKKTGNPWKLFKAEMEKAGKVVFDTEDMDALQEMAHVLHTHPEAKHLMPGVNKDALAETSFFFTDLRTGVRCKARTDIFVPGLKILVPDLKTCLSAKKEHFMYDIMKYGYDIQDAAYVSAVNALMPEEVEEFVFICIEKTPPYCVALHRLSKAFKRRGYMKYREGLELFAACEKEGRWPGYPNDVQDIDPPDYEIRKHDLNNEEEEDHYAPEEYQETA